MRRRHFLKLLGAGAAAVVDPDKERWVRGARSFFIPSEKPRVVQYQPKLYGAMTSINWKALVDDDLKIFSEYAARLAASNRRAQERMAADLFRTRARA